MERMGDILARTAASRQRPPTARAGRRRATPSTGTSQAATRTPRTLSSGRIVDAVKREEMAMATVPTPPSTHRCQVCHDAGYLRIDVPLGHPDFGHLVRCECKREEDARRAYVRARAASNMTPELEVCTFDTFDATHDAEALDLARRWVATLGGWLYLFGNTGNGKTHLAAAAFNALVARTVEQGTGPMPLYVLVPAMLRWMRGAFDVKQRDPTANTSEYDARFDALCMTPILILDDLGAERQTPWVAEQLFQLVDHRYSNRLPTMICSNIAPDDLTQFGIDQRIASRCQDRAFVREVWMQGPDRRLDPTKRTQDERQRRRGGRVVPWWVDDTTVDRDHTDQGASNAQ